ncbi:MAG: hypothetical protein HY060_19340 [Proteobacteria bacterium]|nr:hypothetical protein [Pseudomonadota bacterium]
MTSTGRVGPAGRPTATEPRMHHGARGLAAILMLGLCLGGCTHDSTLGLFGFTRKPAVARVTEPAKPGAPAAPAAAPEEEPVPAAAPRAPVETERVAPPPGGRPRRPS